MSEQIGITYEGKEPKKTNKLVYVLLFIATILVIVMLTLWGVLG